jgi:uncharacterized membrane protein
MLGRSFGKRYGHDPAESHPAPRRSAPVPPQVLKPFTYSVMHLIVAIGVAYALTRDWRIALGVGLIEPIVQTLAYTVHEHLWARAERARGREATPASA